MAMPKIMFMGDPVQLDLSDYMQKSVYDIDNDGIVDKLNKVTDIQELAEGAMPGEIPKVQSDMTVKWDDDEAGGAGDAIGGTI
jgi:hypothetical protein